MITSSANPDGQVAPPILSFLYSVQGRLKSKFRLPTEFFLCLRRIVHSVNKTERFPTFLVKHFRASWHQFPQYLPSIRVQPSQCVVIHREGSRCTYHVPPPSNVLGLFCSYHTAFYNIVNINSAVAQFKDLEIVIGHHVPLHLVVVRLWEESADSKNHNR